MIKQLSLFNGRGRKMTYGRKSKDLWLYLLCYGGEVRHVLCGGGEEGDTQKTAQQVPGGWDSAGLWAAPLHTSGPGFLDGEDDTTFLLWEELLDTLFLRLSTVLAIKTALQMVRQHQ